MTLTRNYQARTNDSMRISQRINMDTFAFGDESYWVRQYQYDAMGNVTKIYGETPDCHDYTYDYRNFLVNDNGTAYEYDGNGNITKKGTTTYTYDTVIKDRLVKVGNTPVTYSTANPLNPATYGNCSYNFKGRRLQSFTKSGSTYNYIYDEQGLRTRKIAPDGSVTKYLYNGTKLAAEIAPNYRLDFLYDENDMLYGFVKDGSAKYFYARDMLQNILGIIDTNGSPVVIYQYTAYGTSTVLQDTAGLASINPFRFKGYYFDNESGMYYCHTRYYVPEWCRWLNADSLIYFTTYTRKNLNLWEYANNTPIYLNSNVSKNNIATLSDIITSAYNNIITIKSINDLLSNNALNKKLKFAIGFVTPENYDMPSWASIYLFYVKGNLGLEYSLQNGFSIGSISFGVLDSTYQTPKWFNFLSDDCLANPNIYFGIGAINANASIGTGLSCNVELISLTAGIQFGDAISLQCKGYVGYGFSLDFSNGLKFGLGYGLGFEISINIDWYNLFH